MDNSNHIVEDKNVIMITMTFRTEEIVLIHQRSPITLALRTTNCWKMATALVVIHLPTCNQQRFVSFVPSFFSTFYRRQIHTVLGRKIIVNNFLIEYSIE